MNKFFKFTILIGVTLILVIVIGTLWMQPPTAKLSSSETPTLSNAPAQYSTPACDGLPECGYIRMHGAGVSVTPAP